MKHTLRLHELPLVTRPGAIRIELACPAGCVKGYIWSAGEEHNDTARAMAKAMADVHAADKAKPPAEYDYDTEGLGGT